MPFQYRKTLPCNSLAFSHCVHKKVQDKIRAEGSATSGVQIQALRRHSQVQEGIATRCFPLGAWQRTRGRPAFLGKGLSVHIAKGFIFILALSIPVFSGKVLK